MTKSIQLSKTERKVVGMAALGGALEFYDFMIFVFLANVISPQYFPAKQHINSLLALFGAFMIGYLARPIGGLIFSHYGDLYGRKKTFYFSIIFMAVPSLFLACLPNYETIGIVAPVILILLRIIQGLAVGGEVPGAITFTFEHVGSRKRGKAIVLIFFSLSLATLFGQGIVALLHALLTQTQLFNWGWRIAFFIGAVLGVFGGYLRKNLSETPEFKPLKTTLKMASLPVVVLIRNYFPQFLQGLSILCMGAVSMFLLFVYMPIYIINFKTHLAIPSHEVQILNMVSLGVFSIAMLFFGYISDFLGRKKLIVLGSFLLTILAYPLFTMILKKQDVTVLASLIVLGVSFAMIAACYGTILAELFPSKIRYTGVGLVYNIAFAALGGTTPLIATALIKLTHHPVAPAFYLMLFSAMGLLGALTIRSKRLH